MYRHPRKTPMTPYYEWIERLNENYNIEDFKKMTRIVEYWYERAKVFEAILHDIPVEVLVQTFKNRFPEATVYLGDKEIIEKPLTN